MFQIGITNTINQTTPVYSWSLTRLFLDREAQKRQKIIIIRRLRWMLAVADMTSHGREAASPLAVPTASQNWLHFPDPVRGSHVCVCVGGGASRGEVIYRQVRRVLGRSSRVILEHWIC